MLMSRHIRKKRHPKILALVLYRKPVASLYKILLRMSSSFFSISPVVRSMASAIICCFFMGICKIKRWECKNEIGKRRAELGKAFESEWCDGGNLCFVSTRCGCW